ncbi:hypothetical protein ACH5A7_21080 [Streptomyces sp. NPDC018955]|uniref:hypothetical protein n=1 Tax=Streptomyces sp. NPDC018955 TaxID=3365055 RepID=UPI00378916BA
MRRRVPRAKYNAAIDAALHERRLRLDAEKALSGQADRQTAANRATTETITRLTVENEALRGIVASLLVGMEAGGRIDDAVSLRRQLGAAEIDLTREVGQRQSVPGVLPAARTFTPAEARLVAELDRALKALAAFEDQCLDLQRSNEQQALQLREQAAVVGEVAS